MIRAGVYYRVSSDDGRQDEANQEPECLQLCRARGWEPVVFRERASGGGSSRERPVWADLLERTRRGELRATVFWSIDRVGRTRVEIVKDLSEIARWGGAIASVRERFLDMPAADAASNPMLAMLREHLIDWWAFMAGDERQKLIERTRAGLARARAAGKRIGREARFTPAALERAIMLRDRGKSWGQIALTLRMERYGEFGRGIVERAVKRALERQAAPSAVVLS